MKDRPNMPGTIDEWPNWRIPLPEVAREIESDPLVLPVAAALDDGVAESEPLIYRRAVMIEGLPLWLAQTNCWIVAPEGPGGECVLIDAPPDPTNILKRLAHHELRLVALFNTHGHVDHIGGVAPWCTTRSWATRTSRSASTTPTATCCSTPWARAGCSARISKASTCVRPS